MSATALNASSIVETVITQILAGADLLAGAVNLTHGNGLQAELVRSCVWNHSIAKLGWRDDHSAVLPQRIRESGLTGKLIETPSDHIEFDGGRDPVANRSWEKI